MKFYHSRVSFNHWIISTYTMVQGKTEETLKALVDQLVYPALNPELFPEPSEHSHSYYLLDRLQNEQSSPGLAKVQGGFFAT